MSNPTTKFVKNIFAQGGDVAPIPDDAQPDNSVSYEDGYTINYSQNPVTNPNAFYFPRDQFNQLINDLSGNTQQYQVSGVPNFITSSDNGGSPYPYDVPSSVLYDDGINGPRAYQNLVNGNIVLPTDSTKWQIINGDTFVVAGGSANAITLTPILPYVGYVIGTYIEFLATLTNTAAATVDVSGIGAVSLKVSTPVGISDLSATMLVAGTIYRIVFDGTNFQLLNPSVISRPFCLVGLSFAGTQTIVGNNSAVVIQYDTVLSDIQGWFDPLTYTFSPTVSGYYILTATQYFTNFTGTADANLRTASVKNGVTNMRFNQVLTPYSATTSRDTTLSGTSEFFMNGTTDTIQIMVAVDMTGETVDIGGITSSRFGLSFAGGA